MSSRPKKDDKHPWTREQFEEQRPELTAFLRSEVLVHLDAGIRKLLIFAPVKSGKREMVEYAAKRDQQEYPNRVHIFITAFHRISDEKQRKEIEAHGVKVFSLTSLKNANLCMAWMNAEIEKGREIVPHFDECDFGSGDKQVVSQIYSAFKENTKVFFILYSATPQEVLFSGEVDHPEFQEMVDDLLDTAFEANGKHIKYTPPATFCGPARFLDEGLVSEATPFFTVTSEGISLTAQGREIIAGLRQSVQSGSKRNILFLRLSYAGEGPKGDRKENKAIYKFLTNCHSVPELQGDDCIIYADKTEDYAPDAASPNVLMERIQWSSDLYWKAKPKDGILIVVADQTSCRSTEWRCHDRMYATHAFRNTTTFSNASQADERPNHYIGDIWPEFQRIKIFTHLKTFQLSADRISYAEYIKQEWCPKKVNKLTAAKLKLTADHFTINSTSSGTPHPEYSGRYLAAERDRILMKLGCYSIIRVSPRVAGTIKEVPVCETEFYPCTPKMFEALKNTLTERFPGHRFIDPFVESAKKGLDQGFYKGYLREWKVYDYKQEIVTQPGWGIKPGHPRLTICKNDGVQGVAIRFHTGVTKRVNSMMAYQSMYGV